MFSMAGGGGVAATRAGEDGVILHYLSRHLILHLLHSIKKVRAGSTNECICEGGVLIVQGCGYNDEWT